MPGRTFVIIAGPDGAIRQLNQYCQSVTGLTPAQVQGQRVWEILPTPEHTESMRTGFLRAAAGDIPEDQRGYWRGRDGGMFPAHWGYSCLLDAEGGGMGVVVTGADLRLSNRMQAELTDALDRQQAILDTAVDGILTIDETGLIQSFNRAAERIFGYRAGEVVGRNVSMLMPQPYRAEHDGYLHNYQTTRRKKIIGIGREVEGLRKDGTTFPLELAVGEVVVSGQRIFTGIIRDITDRKQIELEARRRQDELAHLTRVHSMGDLAAGLAHEINQPLTAILGHSRACLRMIGAGTADMDLLRESMEQIARQGERAAEVIRRLRKYVEKGEIEKQPSDLPASVQEVLGLLQHELREHGVRVQVKAPSYLPPLLLDRVQIEQVLVNLVRNAVEAMAEARVEGPELELVLVQSEAPAGVRTSVVDNGPGFGAKQPDDLFAPFFTTKKSGLGQGLSICRRIVDAHGGRIWAESNQPRGAVFHVWLPLPARDGRNGGLRGAA
ncbi:MAG: PAS domain S-box protein [Nevskia sp.]|nr:PAS domain S-box protein [Nevskia sp.]